MVEVLSVGSGWMVNRICDGFDVYFNVDTMQLAWQLPESEMLDPSLLTHDDIQVIYYMIITVTQPTHILFGR